MGKKGGLMSVDNFDELYEHVDCRISVVTYTNEKNEVVNVAIECQDCYDVLIDYDKED